MFYLLDALMFGLCATIAGVFVAVAWDMAKYVFGGDIDE